MNLTVECSKCLVAPTCPRKGSSPAYTKAGKKVLCVLVGGYGRKPVDAEILSADSLERSLRDGPCMTIAEVPTFEDEMFEMRITTIFAPAVLHPRETTTDIQNRLVPRSHNQE